MTTAPQAHQVSTFIGDDGRATVFGSDGNRTVYQSNMPVLTLGPLRPTSGSTATTTQRSSTTVQPGSDLDPPTSSPWPTSSSTATQSQTSTQPARHSRSSSPSAVPAASAAGIAVGCALAGLLFGLMVACILLRRKHGKGAPPRTAVVGHEPFKTAMAGDIQLHHFLLEATPDKEIAMEMQALGALIRQHVESHYRRGPITADASLLAQSLVGLGFPKGRSPLDAHSVAALCLDPRTRQDALQHVLLRVIFASLDFHSRPELSLLPIPVAAFLNEAPLATGDSVGQPEADASSLALCQWRKLSAFLLHPDRGQRTPLPADDVAVASQAQALTAALNTALSLFTVGEQEQTGHLEAVVIECAKLGYVLLSHPSDWSFVTEDARNGIVVEAGLMKLSNREGVPYSCPRAVVNPVVHLCGT